MSLVVPLAARPPGAVLPPLPPPTTLPRDPVAAKLREVRPGH